VSIKPVENDLKTDERWLLIERIVSTVPFQRSPRLRELLRYLADRSLHGHSAELTEHQIGIAIFGKPRDYNPVEDSSVRVQVRQLRLKLHEYFDGEGHDEAWIVEIPKGGYTPVFHHAQPSPPPSLLGAHQVEIPQPFQTSHGRMAQILISWTVTAMLAVVCLVLWHRMIAIQKAVANPPWPLSEVFSNTTQTHIVLADVSYGMIRIMEEKPGSLEEYLSPDFDQTFMPRDMSEVEKRLFLYLSNSLLTSYADAVAVNAIAGAARAKTDHLIVRSARNLTPRDLQNGNYIFVGSPGSNPWVSLFQDKLSFIEHEGVVGQSVKYFENKHPLAGESSTYQDLQVTGSDGNDYATIALLPSEGGNGKVLILQGLHQEGTEAAGLFLSDARDCLQLRKALGIQRDDTQPVYFEALIRTHVIAGAPRDTKIVATHIIR
jgi:hypothetical protein